MIDGVVNAKKAVVGVLELSQNLRQLPVISMDRFHHVSLVAGSTSRRREAAVGAKPREDLRKHFFVREYQTSSGLGGEVGPTWRGSARFVGRTDDVGLDSLVLSHQGERTIFIS